MAVSHQARSFLAFLLLVSAQAFFVEKATNKHLPLIRAHDEPSVKHGTVDSEPRRQVFTAITTAATSGLFSAILYPTAARASGGATAGKYT